MPESDVVVEILAPPVLLGNQLRGLIRSDVHPVADAHDAVFLRSADEHVRAGHVPEHIVRSPAHEDGIAPAGNVPDDLALDPEKLLVADDAAEIVEPEENLLLVAAAEEFLTEAALAGGLENQFIVVDLYAETASKFLGDKLAAAAELPSDVDDTIFHNCYSIALPSEEASSPSLSLSNLRKSLITRMMETTIDKASEIGKLIHTPFAPMNVGRVYIRGRRKISCRERERKMDIFTIPRHWKRFPETIEKPTRAIAAFIVESPLAENAMSSGSLVNRLTASFGHSTETRKQSVVMPTSHLAVRKKISFTLWYWRAP